MHRVKGREADYVIVVDLEDKLGELPCLIEDDPLFELALTRTSDDDTYPAAEERCLFYVAVKRARHGTYLIADSRRPSPFIDELLGHSPDLPRLGASPRPCPGCGVGTLVTRHAHTVPSSVASGTRHVDIHRALDREAFSARSGSVGVTKRSQRVSIYMKPSSEYGQPTA